MTETAASAVNAAAKPYKVAITGGFRRGKDTVADMLTEALKPGEVTRLAFADALKTELAQMTFDYVAAPEMHGYGQPTPLMARSARNEFEATMRAERAVNGVGWQWWGEWRRLHNGEDYWVNHPLLAGSYLRACANNRHIIITDIRHHNEARWCLDNGFYLIRVEGPCREVGELRSSSHPSERDIPELPVHVVIHNVNGIDYLRAAVEGSLLPRLHDFFT